MDDSGLPGGRHCGLNNELTLLKQLGCYADFTFPAVPRPEHAAAGEYDLLGQGRSEPAEVASIQASRLRERARFGRSAGSYRVRWRSIGGEERSSDAEDRHGGTGRGESGDG